MNANGRRCRQFKNGFRGLAKICNKSIKGGRPIYAGKSFLTVAESIAREKEFARRQAQIKRGKK